VFEHSGRRRGSSEVFDADAAEAGRGHALEADTHSFAVGPAFQNGAAQTIPIRDAKSLGLTEIFSRRISEIVTRGIG
jgi:hypothetical protein